jgi:hypothetical protein
VSFDDTFKSFGLTPKKGVGNPKRLSPDLKTKAFTCDFKIVHDCETAKKGREARESDKKFLRFIINILCNVFFKTLKSIKSFMRLKHKAFIIKKSLQIKLLFKPFTFVTSLLTNNYKESELTI